MVVVEGVARSLNPHINIWEVAQPVVERYIRQNVGPAALLRDLAATARVLTKFGPKLPMLAEAALARQLNNDVAPTPRSHAWVWATLGAAFGVLVTLIATGF